MLMQTDAIRSTVIRREVFVGSSPLVVLMMYIFNQTIWDFRTRQKS